MNANDCESAPRRICICDSEVSYGEHLMEYLRGEGRLPCEVYLYTSRESFLRMETPATARLLVIAESQYSAEIESAGFTDILLLNESSVYMEKPENMSKYQSVDRICSRILAGRPPWEAHEADRRLHPGHKVPADDIFHLSGTAPCEERSGALPEF